MLRSLLSCAAVAMIALTTSAQINVLICAAAPDPTWNTDVQTKLFSTGSFTTIDVFDASLGTPTLAQLLGYDAVLAYSDLGFFDANALGDNLAAYVDSGGGVVVATFATYAPIMVGGAFNAPAYMGIIPDAFTSGFQRVMGTVLLPAHPIMQSVSSFNNGTSSYMTTSTAVSPGSYRVADYDDGSFFIVAKENAGAAGDKRRADLNFYPPSSTVRNDFWVDTTDGAQVMANALLWVAASPTLGTQDLTGDNQLALFPNPALDRATVMLEDANSGSCTLEVLDALGNSVLRLARVPSAGRLELDLDAYPDGVYVVRVSDHTRTWSSRLIVGR